MNLKTKSTEFALTGAFLLILPIVNFAQTASGERNGCAVTDKKQSAQFIVYEGSRAEKYAMLRLRNNTNCPITVETDDVDPTPRQKVVLPDGSFKFEDVESKDGAIIPAHYLLRDLENQTLKSGYGWGDSVRRYKIPAGRSILFEVPLSELKKGGQAVAVPFVYEWEGDFVFAGMTGGVQHCVYFLTDDLPTKIRSGK
ncbi:MAG TPA: hypothetical protein VIL74_05345 [Pyrinomonadaceae bacterium]|jgi:hypothetical protein